MVKSLRFEAKTRKVGNSMVISVPMAFFRHGMIKAGETIFLEIKEGKNGFDG